VNAYLRPRPIRVAYLVEESEDWQALLDAIFAESFARWGGRFTLIVPCENGEIRAAYLPWLEAYDADIIYSYVDLDDSIIERLHEKFGPAFLKKHVILPGEERILDTYRPNLPITPLSALSVTAIMTQGDFTSAVHPVSLVDTHFGTQPSRFLQQNFGCYGQSLRPWPIPRGISDYLKPTIFVPPDILANPRIMPRAEGNIVGSENELIERIIDRRDVIGLAQLSASFVPRLQLDDMIWSRTVNLVVGETFDDTMIFWNALHLTPVWINGGIVTLKVSKDDLADVDRFKAIIKIIKRRIDLPVSGNGSFVQVVVRSASLPEGELEHITQELHAADGFNVYTHEHIASIDAIVPSATAFKNATRHVEPGSPFRPSDWHEVIFAENVFRPPIVLPRHLRDAPQFPVSAKQGLWQVDLTIERAVDHSWVRNVQHHWRLPRRLRMTGAFTSGYQFHGRSSPFCVPRATADGMLSLACGIDGTLPELTVPTDETAFRYAICADRDWLPFTGSRPPRPGLAADMRTSDKGRYLTALLNMSGGIHRAKEIFLSRFWKDRFELLGATPKATNERISAVTQRLRKRFRGGKIDSDDEWARLASLVLAEARAERSPSRYLKFDDLQLEFDKHRNTFWIEHPTATPREEWDESEKRSLEKSVKYLCEREILHQGHEWRCPQCFNNNWVSIYDLKRILDCKVCGKNELAPVAEPWHFRINQFVLEGLREHGLLPAIWCLGRYAEIASESFFYIEAHELFFAESSVAKGKPDAELDLLIVSDGVVRLVEAKASGQGIDIAKTAELAKRLRPDVVTLAVMEDDSHTLRQKLAELERQLANEDIAADLMTSKPNDIREAPTLPTGTAYRMRMF